jgi:hypothetical protein
MSPWQFLERIPGLIAVPAAWSSEIGEKFTAFNTLCLQPDDWQVQSYPCPRECGCWHRVILRHDFLAASRAAHLTPAPAPTTDQSKTTLDFGPRTLDSAAAVAVCRCDPPKCPDLSLTLAEITPLKLSWTRLGRELCRALTLTSKFTELAPSNTVQIGSWSSDAVPVILTIQNEHDELRDAICELGMRLYQKPFILLAPTSNLLTAPCHEYLATAHAAFFALENIVTLTDHGTLHPTRPPGELFAPFNSQPRDAHDENIARQAFALIQKLDSDQPRRPPTVLAVFRLYCIEEMTATRIARKYRCAKATILNRLRAIRAATGTDPQNLRRLSPHLAQIEDAASDPRAKHIHRQNLISDPDDPNTAD